MQYDFNQLADPKRFQRLVNAVLTARFGEDARITPLQGTDGGSDGETAPDNPNMLFEYQPGPAPSNNPLIEPPRPGRYLFQVKFHRTGDQRLSDTRTTVVGEFRTALRDLVLERDDRQDVNYFFLVTNVTSSSDSIRNTDNVRGNLVTDRQHLHADVWWGERIMAALDWAPDLWPAFPELFPGRVPPFLIRTSSPDADGLAQTFRIAISHQHRRDSTVKFRQIELEQRLLDLFVDLDVELTSDSGYTIRRSVMRSRAARGPWGRIVRHRSPDLHFSKEPNSALEFLIDDNLPHRRILLEGGPGQGKSTITQMVAQIYREKLLGTLESSEREPSWHQRCRMRLPIHLELREFAHWLSTNAEASLEEFMAHTIGRAAGGATVTIRNLQDYIHRSSVILLLDGLDEIGNDNLRDNVLDSITETLHRFETGLRVDCRVILTTRPPAVVGRQGKLEGFTRVVLAPMASYRIDEYLARWLSAQIQEEQERERVRASFQSRRYDPHVDALARNPMQLSVLLQFIYLKGDAFPDKRAELYRDYFQIVIDRDVEKSPELRKDREILEGLHSFLGFRLHGTTEIERGRRSLNRNEIITLAGQWLGGEGHSRDLASRYFALGEERFGLIVALSGEGHETTYGFEVQPIQEYFAAAYISDQLPGGNAHEIFELLIHRSYWREVALFLAGLRRHNEKADLVSRAKAADSEVQHVWMHNGRAIALQLLREGVLGQPRHVMLEAMSFVLDSLDPPSLRLHRRPDSFINAAAQLGCLYVSDATHARIREVVNSLADSDDLQLLALVHRLAARVLPEEQYMELVLASGCRSPEVRSLVRLRCPYERPSALAQLSCSANYWSGIPIRALSRDLWLSALRHGVVPDLTFPTGMHSALVLQFAASTTDVYDHLPPIIQITGESPFAIWSLQQGIGVLRTLVVEAEPDHLDDLGTPSRYPLAASPFNLNDGDHPLPATLKLPLKDLLQSIGTIIRQANEGSSVADSVSHYVQTIRRHLRTPGLGAWIACRCGSDLLRSHSQLIRSPDLSRSFNQLFDDLSEFYGTDRSHLGQRRYFAERFPLIAPLALRLHEGGDLLPLDQVIASILRNDLSPLDCRTCSWLADAPIPAVLVRSLLYSCRDFLPDLLTFIGGRLSGPFIGRRLRVQDTHRILKICRQTDDSETLRAAADMLTNATFSRIAEPSLIIKIMSAAPASPFVARVLDTSRNDEVRRSAREHEMEIARQISTEILDDPDQHPFRVVNLAAVLEAEAHPTTNSPLFEERPELANPATLDAIT